MPLPQQRVHTLQQKLQESVRQNRTAAQGQHVLRGTTTVRQRRCDGLRIRLQVQQNIAVSPECCVLYDSTTGQWSAEPT